MIPLPWLALGVVLAIGAALGAGYVKGRADGRVTQIEDTVDAYRERTKVDAEIRDLPDARLCVELGGLPDDCAALRGLVENPGEAGDGGVSGR